MFRKLSVLNHLMLPLLILGWHCWLGGIPNRRDLPDELAPVRYLPAGFRSEGFDPLRLVGAWRVEVGDSRFGGVSALAIDDDQLVALTDSGTVIRLPRPGMVGSALVHDLGDGPGSPDFKRNRDSEALARDPSGRGWWVAFEHWHQLWLYDSSFTREVEHINLGLQRWPRNKGIEAMVTDGQNLILFSESGKEWLAVSGGRVRSRSLVSHFGSIGDATRTGDGRLLLVARKIGLAGLAKRMVAVEQDRTGNLRLQSLARLGLGAVDNVEAIAAEPRPGGTRLWLMTDNDFRPRAPTYLVALDLP